MATATSRDYATRESKLIFIFAWNLVKSEDHMRSTELLPHLKSSNVVDDDQVKDVEAKGTPAERTIELLLAIYRNCSKRPEVFDEFCRVVTIKQQAILRKHMPGMKEGGTRHNMAFGNIKEKDLELLYGNLRKQGDPFRPESLVATFSSYNPYMTPQQQIAVVCDVILFDWVDFCRVIEPPFQKGEEYVEFMKNRAGYLGENASYVAQCLQQWIRENPYKNFMDAVYDALLNGLENRRKAEELEMSLRRMSHTHSTQPVFEEAIRIDEPVLDSGFETFNVQGEKGNLSDAKHLLDLVDLAKMKKKKWWKRGAFGRIYCESIKGTEYAIKEIEAWDEDHKKVVKKEVEAFANITGCENIVTFYDVKWDDFYCYLLLEKCLYNLDTAVKEKTPLELKDVLTDMCKGLHFLHHNRIIHKDIKPTNVLLARREDGKLRAKLADFGASVYLQDHSSATLTKSGTDGWRAPESEDEKGRLRLSYDVFCFGLVSYFTATKGIHPFKFNQAKIWRQKPPDCDALKKLSEKKDRPPGSLSPFESASLLRLVTEMLSVEHDKRPAMTCVKEDCFFWGWMKIYQFFKKIWSDAQSAELADEPNADSGSSLDDEVVFHSSTEEEEELDLATSEKRNEMDELTRKRNEAKRRIETLDNKEWGKGDWTTKLDNKKLREWAGGSQQKTAVTGFITFMRNKVEHWQRDVERWNRELPYDSERSALEYFLNCYPDLLPRVYEVSVDEIPQYL